MNETTPGSTGKPLWRSPYGLGLLIILGIIFFFLWTEHRAHLLGALPLLLLLAVCPLMHFFMHRGHHHGPHDDSGKGDSDPDQEDGHES